jgi:uncharacterized protein (TIGR03085 family)
VTDHAAAERRSVADLLETLGPDQPTLCDGWTTFHLAAHLALRDRTPAAWPGLAMPRFAGHTERLLDRFMVEHTFDECVRLVRGGAPVWSPMGLPGLARVTNLLEYVVHHEDARRAQPEWLPRIVPTALADAVWAYLRPVVAMAAFRRAPDGVRLVRAHTGRAFTAARGAVTVTVEGDPIELLLYAFDRRAVARVDLRGPEDAIARLAAAPLGL